MQKTIWITGLSGAGKSTLAAEVCKILRNNSEPVICLDGDQLREVFDAVDNSKVNHGRGARLSLAMQYAHLCHIISEQDVTVVIATISMFKEIHEWNRNNLRNYFEVFLKVPIEELKKRDPKDIYLRYDRGELSDVAGLDLEVDEPDSPDLLFEFDNNKNTVKEMADIVISKLEEI
jgi:adenylylsulfate kinase